MLSPLLLQFIEGKFKYFGLSNYASWEVVSDVNCLAKYADDWEKLEIIIGQQCKMLGQCLDAMGVEDSFLLRTMLVCFAPKIVGT